MRGRKKRNTRTSQPSPSGGADDVPPEQPVTLTIYLRHRQRIRRRPGSAADLAELTQRVSRRDLAAQRKRLLKRPLELIRQFAKRNRMKVVDVDYQRRQVQLRCAASAAEDAFATKIKWTSDPLGARCHRPARAPRIPPALARAVHAVLGLDTRPLDVRGLRSHIDLAGADGLLPSQIARLYGVDGAGRGAGQCIALIEPSGGYRTQDVVAACKAMNVPPPRIVDINVGKGRNVVGLDAQADREVALDIQVVAGIAPEASIAVYFTEAGAPGLVAGVAEAVHGAKARPSVIVMTWGQPEESWPLEARLALDAVLQDAVRLGITVVVSAGDDFATEGMTDGSVHVDYPASSPYVLGCGGTQITLDDAQAKIASEVVWNELRHGTGGGVSTLYSVPRFQNNAPIPGSLNDGKRGRGVPDVAATAAEQNGYRIIVDGQETIDSGTSAVAPLWGAFIALLNARRNTSLGFVNDGFYAAPDLFNRVTSGNNAGGFFKIGYEATPDKFWNACTGLGTPKGAAIIAAMTAVA